MRRISSVRARLSIPRSRSMRLDGTTVDKSAALRMKLAHEIAYERNQDRDVEVVQLQHP